MNNEKLKQIRESITNTVSCIDAHNGDHLTNTVLNAHLRTLTDMEAEALGLSCAAQDDNDRSDLRQELLGVMDFLAGLARSGLSANKMRGMARNKHDHLSSVVASRGAKKKDYFRIVEGNLRCIEIETDESSGLMFAIITSSDGLKRTFQIID